MHALGIGIGTKNSQGDWLEVYYPRPAFHPDQSLTDSIAAATGYSGGNTDIELDGELVQKLEAGVKDAAQKSLLGMLKDATKPVVLTMIDTDSALTSTP